MLSNYYDHFQYKQTNRHPSYHQSINIANAQKASSRSTCTVINSSSVVKQDPTPEYATFLFFPLCIKGAGMAI